MLRKGTRINLITKRKIVLEIFVPMDVTPLLRRREIASYVESQGIMHLSANVEQGTIILLRQI